MKHYSEADLLETYYTQPGESMPVMMHLASCGECSSRYDKLDRKMREAAVCHTERPATFWARQRLSIMKKIGLQRAAASQGVRTWRVAAAAFLAFLLGGAVVYKVETTKQTQPQIVHQAVYVEEPAPDDEVDVQTPRDPWESDELEDFHGVVQWESWVAQSKTTKGDASL